jgi:GT2 family glycosyltransferase
VNPAAVTIVVLNWNLRDDTLACLASLERAALGGAQVLVVDNGSRDGSVAAIRERFPHVRVLALPENRGYAGGNNAGIRAALDAGAEGVLLLNNDTEVAPDFLAPLVQAAEPGVAAVSSTIFRLDRRELLDVGYAEVHFGRRHVVQLAGANALPGERFARRQEIQVAVGCSVLLRAEALRTVGLFDEEYFAYHEDVDWCLRARKYGYRLLLEPHSRVYHRRSGSTVRDGATAPAGPGGEPVLPGAEPPPWNPVRAYLGARNLIRLLRAHATTTEKRLFLRACARELPLELLAVAWGREGWMTLGRWGWRDAARYALVERRLVGVPCDVWRAYRAGRLEQFLASVRGLRDGYLRRPVPLDRLGLR